MCSGVNNFQTLGTVFCSDTYYIRKMSKDKGLSEAEILARLDKEVNSDLTDVAMLNEYRMVVSMV